MLREQKNDFSAEAFDLILDYQGQMKENAEKIFKHGNRANRIVTRMMELSPSEGGQHRRVALNALVKEYTDIARQGRLVRHPNLELSIHLDLDPSIGVVALVDQEIARVIINMVNNAADALMERKRMEGPSFRPTLRVSTQNRGTSVEIRFRDNGKGIAPGQVAQIFQPFFTTKAAEQGNIGLGLSLCHDIVVEGHEGKIEVASEEDRYTEFIITLPRHEAS